jgi:ribosomal protein L40E
MVIKTLDPQKCLEIVSQYENVLSGAQKSMEEYFSKLICIKCGSGSVERFPYFTADEDGISRVVYDGLLPKQMAKCKKCMCEFEPYTKLITKEK